MIMKNRGANIEYSDLETLYCRIKQRRWQDKHNFDLKRYHFLDRKLQRIDDRLEKAEE